MRQPLVVGNWKMNGSKASVTALLDGIKQGIGDVKKAEVAVCAPYIYLPAVAAQLADTTIAWGAQNLSTEQSGAFTGEISASMLLDFSCRYVIVGHSERRSLYGESDEMDGVAALRDSVIAYEPIWAIGTGKTATPEQAQEVHAFIRGHIAKAGDADVAAKVRILYGGSMNAANAATLLAQADIDGGLIGGASLKADDFLTICRAAN